MSLLAQATMVDDNGLIGRVAACAASHGVAEPRTWAVQNRWALGAQPGWGVAYAQALAKETPGDPAAYVATAGSDPTVITDQMIMDGVAAVLDGSQAVTLTGVAEIEAVKAAAVEEITTLKSETLAAMQPPDPA